MQLFLVAPFFIYLIWRWKKSGLITLATFILGSLTANAAILAIYNLPQNVAGLSINRYWFYHLDFIVLFYFLILFSDDEKSIAYMNLIYNKIWTRAPPYLIGIWTGWFLNNAKNSKLQLSLVRFVNWNSWNIRFTNFSVFIFFIRKIFSFYGLCLLFWFVTYCSAQIWISISKSLYPYSIWSSD